MANLGAAAAEEGNSTKAAGGRENNNNNNTAGAGVFEEFAGCVMGDLMYVLQDSLDRLASIRDIQRAKKEDDGARWEALRADEKSEKERFLGSQENAVRQRRSLTHSRRL